MAKWQYTKGVHGLGDGHYAWLWPDGSWGWSNAGLIEDSGQTLLVDTLFDLKSTREMLDAMRRAVPAAASIGALVNTHSNGDHCFGNQLLEGARIIASKACEEEMHLRLPEEYAKWQKQWPTMGIAGKFWWEVMGSRFDYSGIHLAPPNETFSGEMTLHVGDKEVKLIEVGPAHTRGDVLVYVPKDKVAYAGDILFNQAHPAIWTGPVSNWIKACDLMLTWDLQAVVPGHGAIMDKNGIREFRDYLAYVLSESRKCYDKGMSFEQATRSISLDPWAHFAEEERMYANVYAAYLEIKGGPDPDQDFNAVRFRLLGLMGEWRFGREPQ